MSRPDTRPLHLHASPGDKRSICGIKKALPVCWARHAEDHLLHRPGCPACLEGAGLATEKQEDHDDG